MPNFVEPLDVFFGQGAAFCDAVIWNGSTTVYGIFDDPYQEAFGGGVVEGHQPQLQFRLADVETVARGDTMQIGSAFYSVASVEKDRAGGVVKVMLTTQ